MAEPNKTGKPRDQRRWGRAFVYFALGVVMLVIWISAETIFFSNPDADGPGPNTPALAAITAFSFFAARAT